MNKDKDFDKVIDVMKNQFNWRDDISDERFAFTNELIKSTKIVMGLNS